MPDLAAFWPHPAEFGITPIPIRAVSARIVASFAARSAPKETSGPWDTFCIGKRRAREANRNAPGAAAMFSGGGRDAERGNGERQRERGRPAGPREQQRIQMVQTKEVLSRTQRTDLAIAHALAGRWDLAADENRALLDEDGRDVETANRLGKALTELGDVPAAIEAYEYALSVDATNAIARKNLARLSARQEQGPAPRGKRAGGKAGGKAAKAEAKRAPPPQTASPPGTIRLQSLIEESGKSTEFALHRPDAGALAQVSDGDTAELRAGGEGVAVVSQTGATLGWIEPATAARLRRMMEGGNRYAAIVRNVGDGEATVYVREVYTHPSLAGQASFLTRPSTRRPPPRAYTKVSATEHEVAGPDAEEEDADAQDASGAGVGDSGGAGKTQDAEMEERGFTATGADGGDDEEESTADGGDEDSEDPEDGDAAFEPEYLDGDDEEDENR